jgi:hypothetical protein
LAHIHKVQQLHGQALQTARIHMRWHAILVDLEIVRKQRRSHAAALQFLHLLPVIVDALPSRGDLQAPEQQVKAQRDSWICRVFHGIEGALGFRIMRHKHKLTAGFLAHRVADGHFFFR